MLSLFFKNPGFRNYLLYTVFGNVAWGIFGIFMMWFIHSEFQNPFYTGFTGFMFAVTSIASFLVGPFVDKRNKATLLRFTQFTGFLVILAILGVYMTAQPGVWFYHAMIFIVATISLISAPAGAALMPRIVGDDELLKANSFIQITGILFGIGVGVFLFFSMVQGVDSALIFAVCTVLLFISVIFSIFLRSGEEANENTTQTNTSTYFAELKEGFVFIKSSVLLLLIIAVLAQDFAVSIAYVNVPMLAQIHTGEASAYIILTAMALMGGLIGAYVSRIIGPRLEVWKVLFACFVLAGIARILFVHVIVDNFARSLIIHAFYIGMGSTIGIFFHTLTQKLPPKRLVARVSTIIVSLVGITSALGALLGGILGSILPNIDMIFVLQGGIYIAAGVIISMLKKVRALPKIDKVAGNDGGVESDQN